MIENILERLSEIFSSAWGWVLCLFMVLLDYATGYETMVNIAVMAVVIDTVWGIASSIKQGRFALSELARNVFPKLLVYGSVIICFIGIDKLLGTSGGLTTSIICAVIVLIELWSASASMLICFPSMPFLQLLRKALTGEIARKLNVEPKDVESVLQSMKRNEKH